ncbi:hypothetical protein OIU76_027091 [Salix suchowensis]|nr:hypothetical protein OIU76_027091 [Salix suchowensis]
MESKEAKPKVKKGLWKPDEDLVLKTYVETHGEGNWSTVSKKSGLMRGGKSCRLRWKNYLRPNIKRGGMSQEEEDMIIRMHKLLGNRSVPQCFLAFVLVENLPTRQRRLDGVI